MAVNQRKIKLINIIFKSLLLSSLLYSLYLFSGLNKTISSYESDFSQFSSTIDEYKQMLLMTSMLLEEHIEVSQDEKVVLNNEEKILKTLVYKKKNAELTNIDKLILEKLFNIKESIPLFINDIDAMFYRSYQSNLFITALKPIQGVDIDLVLSKEQCELNRSCTKYNSSKSLSDRIIISSRHQDPFTKKDVLTIASPIYVKNEIVADISIDMSVDDYPFFRHKTFIRKELPKNEIKTDTDKNVITVITDNRYPMSGLSYSTEYVADDRNVFVYKVSFIQVIIESIWIFVLLMLISIALFWKYAQLKENQKKLETVASHVFYDSLTGLYNRYLFQEERFLQDLQKKPIVIIAFDGDHLKHINDQYGHHVGDEAIRQIAQGMRAIFRNSDYLIRCGGDEFIAILPFCEKETADTLVAALQDRMINTIFSEHHIFISVSAGVTEMLEGETLESAMERADALLYAAKRFSHKNG